MDIPIEASNPEYSGGQVEVNIEYGPALAAADRATLMRSLVRVLARKAGMNVTFMAKPWTDEAGNGMHVHQSLWRDTRNAFSEGDGLSQVARHYAAGLLSRIREYALLGSPTPNAYHRRSDHTFAPTRVCWGADNRTLAVRAITDRPKSTRLEQRDAAADCNVYLALAGQIAAGLEGVREHREPPPPAVGDAYAREDLPDLPRTFLNAYELLDGILEDYVEDNKCAEEIAAERNFDLPVVRRVTQMVERAEYKRQQAAPTLKITGKAFGMGWRFPIAAKIEI